MKLVHVISGLNTGGAEMMLFKLLSVWDRETDQVEVISLTDIGIIGDRIRQLNIPVRALEMQRGRPSISGLFRLSKWLRQSAPDLVQTWMYHADLIGGLAAKLAGNLPVVWGIRNGLIEPQGNKRMTIWTARLCARLSGRIPKQIAVNSENARCYHEAMGYCGKKMSVIPNGFDLAAFKPDPEARRELRSELRLPAETLLIGLVARFDPQKDHRNFVQAARLISARVADVHFVLCGDGIDRQNRELSAWITGENLADKFHLLGRRDDIPRITSGLDIASCSSYAEAFPNVLGEAMACGVPCVTTDVGDAAFIVGDAGNVVPARNPQALADAWSRLIESGPAGRQRLGESARQRVKEQFDLQVIASRYGVFYREILSN